MEENTKKEIGFKTEHEKISKTYSNVYTIIFRYTLSIIGIIVSIFILNQIIKSNYLQNISIFPDRDANLSKKEELLKTFFKEINQNIDNKDVEIQIIQGKLYSKGDFLYSIDNLIKYKGFIMPKMFKIEKNSPLSNVDYFDSEGYEINKLEEFINNIIFVDKDNIKFESQENEKLNLQGDIEKTFNLGCIFENKITDKMCNYYTDEFLKYFFIYNLKTDVQGLKKINDKLSNTKKYKEFCKGIKNYIIYSNDPENNLKEIIESCGSTESIDEFNKIKNFIEIQKELNEGYIKDKYYSHKDLNAYKLLSFQQILYNDINAKKIDKIRLNNYVIFLKNLIKKNNIQQFYKEEIYRFNNYFLIKNIEEISKEKSFEILKDLYSINKGDRIFGIPALIGQLKNKELENYLKNTEQEEHNISENLSGSQEGLTDTLLKGLYDLSFFTITNSSITGKDTVLISGYFHISDQEIKSNITLERELNNLIVKDINLDKYSGLSKILKNIISKESRGINKIYQYISENIETYGNETDNNQVGNIGICDIIRSRIDKNIIECTNDRILIEKDGTNYKISIKDDTVNNVEISDKEIEKDIQEQLKLSGYNNLSIIETIQGILNYKIEEEIIISGNQDSILINDIFIKYLGTKSDEVVESNGLFYIKFDLKNIKFICEFNFEKREIKSLYFGDILLDGKNLKIKNFSITLDENNKDKINQFTLDPINYIKKIDNFSYLNYQNKFGTKK